MPAEITGSRFSGGQVSIRPLFVCDGSPEVEAWLSALRTRGYDVFQVPLGLLFNRVAVQKPALVLLDVDQRNALNVAQRMRDLPGTRDIHLLFVGTLGRTLSSPSDAAFYEAAAFLPRPVDVSELLKRAEALVGKPEARNRSSGASNPPSLPLGLSMRPPTLTVFPETGPASTPHHEGASSHPPGTESIQVHGAVLPPGALSVSGPALSMPPSAGELGKPEAWAAEATIARQLSVELQTMLREAEERWGGVPPAPPPTVGYSPHLTPDEEVNGVLPPDVLRALEEPLEPLDEDGEVPDEEDDAARESEVPPDGSMPDSEGRSELSDSMLPQQEEDSLQESAPHVAVTAAPPMRRGSRPPPSSPLADEVSAAEASRRPTPVPPRRPTPVPTAPPPRRPSAAPPASVTGRLSSVPPPPSNTGEQVSDPGRVTVPPPQVAVTRPRGRAERAPVAIAARSPSQPPPVTDPSVDVLVAQRATRTTTAPPSRRADSERTGNTGTILSRRAEVPRPAPIPRELSEPPQAHAAAPVVPQKLGKGDSLRGIAQCVSARYSGCLAIESDEGVRRVVFREGDFVTAVSALEGESLVAFLRQRGDLSVDAAKLERRIPPYGRHAGAALVAHGHLRQEELWPVLRAHAEWVLGRALQVRQGTAGLEEDLPARLQGEPGVFGGATGAEVLTEIARRVVSPEESLERLGGPATRMMPGPHHSLLVECALGTQEQDAVKESMQGSVGEVLARVRSGEFATVLYVLRELAVIETVRAIEPVAAVDAGVAEAARAIDDDAIRSRIASRRALVTEGDYFTLLGLSPQATGYEIRHAYLQLRKDFDPSRILTARTTDLRDDLELILEILDEAYEILRDDARRERYRAALAATSQ